MADKRAQRLAAMSASAAKRGKSIRPVSVHSNYMSLIEMLNLRGDDYPSLSKLDSYSHSNKIVDEDVIRSYNQSFSFPARFTIKMAGPGDRTCHWKQNSLFVYVDALLAGLRFPLHPFIPTLLADIQVNPCQIVPNGWRIINCFMVLCLLKKLEMTVPLFRKIFQFKNSSNLYPGWVYINHRPNMPHIFDNASIPDNNTHWKDEFVQIEWEGGDWGTLFRSSFGRVVDGSPEAISLSEREQEAYDALIADDPKALSWDLLNEFTLKEVGLSRASDKAAEKINELTVPATEETGRMKRLKAKQDPRVTAELPAFLQPHRGIFEGEGGSTVRAPKSVAFKPNWGFRKTDTVVGSTAHSQDWSLHSITPEDYKELVLGGTEEQAKALGCQALASANVFFQSALHQVESWKTQANEHRKKLAVAEGYLQQAKEKIEEQGELLKKAHAELVELRADEEATINKYLDSEEYQDLIKAHDDLVYPANFTIGWNGALKAILEKHPGLFKLEDFPSPESAEALQNLMRMAGQEERDGDSSPDVRGARQASPEAQETPTQKTPLQATSASQATPVAPQAARKRPRDEPVAEESSGEEGSTEEESSSGAASGSSSGETGSSSGEESSEESPQRKKKKE